LKFVRRQPLSRAQYRYPVTPCRWDSRKVTRVARLPRRSARDWSSVTAPSARTLAQHGNTGGLALLKGAIFRLREVASVQQLRTRETTIKPQGNFQPAANTDRDLSDLSRTACQGLRSGAQTQKNYRYSIGCA
jgi:hypothetical protein